MSKNIADIYFFSCWPSCESEEINLANDFSKKYKTEVFNGRMPLIMLDFKNPQDADNISYHGDYQPSSIHPFERINLRIMQITKVPQF